MAQAGFDTVFVGIETPNEGSLDECGKTQNLNRDLVESVKRLQRGGLQVQGGFIVGFDSDTPSIFKQQFDFIQKSGIVTAMVGMLQAPIGTRLFERMRKENRLVKEFSGDNADGSTNIIPQNGSGKITGGLKALMNALYAPKEYTDRVITFLREYNPPKIRPASGVAAHPGIFQVDLPARYPQCGTAGSTGACCAGPCCAGPKLFPLAVTLAIYGFHFRKVNAQNFA